MPYFNIGPAPAEEECPQVGEPDFRDRALAVCIRFIDALRAKFGPEPMGARLEVKVFEHDFGTYYEVVCHYAYDVPKSEAYALKCANDAPTKWAW